MVKTVWVFYWFLRWPVVWQTVKYRRLWVGEKPSRSVGISARGRQVEEVINNSGAGLAMFPHEAECMIRRPGQGSAMSLCAMYSWEAKGPLFRSLCRYPLRAYRAMALHRTPLALSQPARLSKSARSSSILEKTL